MPESNNIWVGVPTWARAIGLVGFPAVIASALVLFLIAVVNQRLGTTNDLIIQHMAAASLEHRDMLREVQDAQRNQERILDLLRQICLHTSETPEDRRNCVR